MDSSEDEDTEHVKAYNVPSKSRLSVFMEADVHTNPLWFLSASPSVPTLFKAQLAIPQSRLVAIIADEDTCVGFLLGGIGEINDDLEPNFMVVDRATNVEKIEECFIKFTRRVDIVILLIVQHIADQIRSTINKYKRKLPAIVEIPCKEHPFDSNRDRF